MNDTITEVNTPRLLQLARWLTHEERKRRLGQPSEWDQGVWVRAYQAEYDERGNRKTNVEVQGDQVFWSCGTAACLAGHIALEDGGLPAFYNHRQGGLSPFPIDNDLATLSDSQMYFGGRPEPIDEHAKRSLGLDSDQASRLFDGENDYDRITYLISEFTGIEEQQLLRMVGGIDLPPNPDDSWHDSDEDDDDTW